MLAVCGLGSFLILADERRGREADTDPTPVALPRDIGSRVVDPEPLTVPEVFPGEELLPDPQQPPYQVLRTEETPDCRTAVTGEIGRLLTDLGCDQVVRATVRSPNGAYLATAGVFNLADAAGADRAHREIKPLVGETRNRFQGMAAGAGTEPVVLAPAQLGWHVRGHFLVYCVIARADGEPVADDDPNARRILFDLIERHLRGEVLGRRTIRTWRSAAADG